MSTSLSGTPRLKAVNRQNRKERKAFTETFTVRVNSFICIFRRVKQLITANVRAVLRIIPNISQRY